MKQVTQRLRDGAIQVLEVPPPSISRGMVLIDVRASLLSAGTERTKVATARKNLVGKALSRPDDVRRVLEKARRDGVSEAVGAVRLRLDAPSELGYSAAGVVTAVGAGVRCFAIGDRVACGGGGYAVHAEVDLVPANLCARIPDGVPFEHAAFATVGAIAMQGVRQADVRLGERVAVIGLGLVGQMTAQILRAAGCTVVGIDVAPEPVEVALRTGAADAAFERQALNGTLPLLAREVDGVIVTAATPSSDPLELAARLCRDRGRVVVVGDVGMVLPRTPYYEKELDIRLSRSYGPGRYDREYEEKGLDYPIGYVRWTEQRNMEALLDLVSMKRVDIQALISRQFRVDEAGSAYEELLAHRGSPFGIVLTYGPSKEEAAKADWQPRGVSHSPAVGFVGSGSFAQRVLMPAFREAGFAFAAVASGGGLSAVAAVERFGFLRADDAERVITSRDVDCVVVATRHGLHAHYVCRALHAGKHVFVEKPPALTVSELDRIHDSLAASSGRLFVGYNRRFAPLAGELRAAVTTSDAPAEILYRVNAGHIDAAHWLNDLDEGGGRLLGEGCHFFDFVCWLTGALPITVTATMGGTRGGQAAAAAQSFTAALAFANGSVASILYGAGGSNAVGKEYIELHCGGTTAILHDFGKLEVSRGRRRTTSRQRPRDKGHRAQAVAVRAALEGTDVPEGPSPLDTTRVTLAALESALSGRAVCFDPTWRS